MLTAEAAPEAAPADPILGLTVAYKADTHPNKLNLGIGAYRDAEGRPWVLPCVREAELEIAQNMGADKEYLPIQGLDAFRWASARLILGADAPSLAEKRVEVIQSLSGTGSLRLCADFVAKFNKSKKIYISVPTWGNHRKIFTHAGLTVCEYRYVNFKNQTLDLEGMLADLSQAEPGSIVLLHACAHNPSGVDPTAAEWARIADVVQQRGLIALFDSAYQGFASGDLDIDAASVRLFDQRGMQFFVAQSFSKNLGLYGERVGALVAVCDSPSTASAVLSQ